MNTPLLGYVPPKKNEDGEGIYIYQITEPEDVAAQLLWLGSNHATFITGEVVIIDGGLHVTSNGYEQYVQQAEYADQLLANKDL